MPCSRPSLVISMAIYPNNTVIRNYIMSKTYECGIDHFKVGDVYQYHNTKNLAVVVEIVDNHSAAIVRYLSTPRQTAVVKKRGDIKRITNPTTHTVLFNVFDVAQEVFDEA